jgi:hypothetical protein
MQVTAFEGVIEDGQIRLTTNINLPERTKVYVIIPGYETQKGFHIYSPRLAHPEQAADFQKEIVEDSPNASL